MKAHLEMPVSASLLSVLEASGHEGVHAHQLGLDRAPDEDLLALARREQRKVITADLDFPRMLALSAAEGPGLILFRGGTYSFERRQDHRVHSAVRHQEAGTAPPILTGGTASPEEA